MANTALNTRLAIAKCPVLILQGKEVVCQTVVDMIRITPLFLTVCEPCRAEGALFSVITLATTLEKRIIGLLV